MEQRGSIRGGESSWQSTGEGAGTEHGDQDSVTWIDPEACAEETVPAGYRELGHRCWKRGADEEEEGMEGVVEGWRGGWVSSQG